MSEPGSSKLKNENIPGCLKLSFFKKQTTNAVCGVSVCLSVCQLLSAPTVQQIIVKFSVRYIYKICWAAWVSCENGLIVIRTSFEVVTEFWPVLPIFLTRSAHISRPMWMEVGTENLHPVLLSWCECSTRQLQLRSQRNVALLYAFLIALQRSPQKRSPQTLLRECEFFKSERHERVAAPVHTCDIYWSMWTKFGRRDVHMIQLSVCGFCFCRHKKTGLCLWA